MNPATLLNGLFISLLVGGVSYSWALFQKYVTYNLGDRLLELPFHLSPMSAGSTTTLRETHAISPPDGTYENRDILELYYIHLPRAQLAVWGVIFCSATHVILTLAFFGNFLPLTVSEAYILCLAVAASIAYSHWQRRALRQRLARVTTEFSTLI